MFGCIDEAGEGGTAVVQGKIYKVVHPNDVYNFKTSGSYVVIDEFSEELDSFKVQNLIAEVDTFPSAKEDVYIVYGDKPIYGDKMETGPDGFYQFKYLAKGTYKVFAYTSFSSGQKSAVAETVTVGTGETKNAGDIYIHTGKSLDKSYIKGVVKVQYYNKTYPNRPYTLGNDIRVYIQRKGAAYQFNELRTGFDGSFVFQELEPGDYEVFVLTEEKLYSTLRPVKKNINVPKKGVLVSILNPFEILIND